MSSKFALVFGLPVLSLAGCATVSFAPPRVALGEYPTPTIDLAIAETDRFIQAYRTAAGTAANGRAGFEVPAFLTSLGALTATAFGAGPNVAIGAGAAGTALSGGNSYFAPKAKASILRSGIVAFECIQQVATGVKPYVHEPPTSVRHQLAELANGPTSNYFYLVRNATVSVDTIIGDRLSNAGSLNDAKALATEFEKLVKQRIADEQKGKALQGAMSTRMGATAVVLMTEDEVTKIAQMQTDLQLCVLRARS